MRRCHRSRTTIQRLFTLTEAPWGESLGNTPCNSLERDPPNRSPGTLHKKGIFSRNSHERHDAVRDIRRNVRFERMIRLVGYFWGPRARISLLGSMVGSPIRAHHRLIRQFWAPTRATSRNPQSDRVFIPIFDVLVCAFGTIYDVDEEVGNGQESFYKTKNFFCRVCFVVVLHPLWTVFRKSPPSVAGGLIKIYFQNVKEM